jgi:hypothetical protein
MNRRNADRILIEYEQAPAIPPWLIRFSDEP